MEREELKKILVKHLAWLNNEDGGERANLSGADLSRADLSGADLSRADLSGAVLSRADLYEAGLSGADLQGADLRGANLSWADLQGADLQGADLGRANLSGADLSGAVLSRAGLSGANLSWADLQGADLQGADLQGANLSWADLRGAKNVPFIPMACPSDGSFIGWKKCSEFLVKLEIPEDAKRSSATTTKCRCDKAKVLEIINLEEGKPAPDSVTNHSYTELTYTVGEMVYPDSFDEDRWNQCSHGIHFFINKQEAINL